MLVEAEREPRAVDPRDRPLERAGRRGGRASAAPSHGHSIAVPETSPSPWRRVAVAGGEERAVDRDRQEERRPGDELLAVDVAAAAAAAGRSSGRPAPPAACRARRGTARARPAARRRARPRRRAPSRSRAASLASVTPHAPGRDLVDPDGERLARARAAHLDRPGERVAVVELRRSRGSNGSSRLEPPARVRRREPDGVARVDRQHRLEVAREVPVQRAPLERQLVDH